MLIKPLQRLGALRPRGFRGQRPLVNMVPNGTHKIRKPTGFLFLWVPGGTRTHDIQNHNLTL